MAEETRQPISFKGINEAREKTMTRPGTKDVFTIMDVKFGNTKNTGAYYMQCQFETKTTGFGHSFFLSEKALPRVKSLLKSALRREIKDDEAFTEETLTKLLTNKQIALKVSGKVDRESGKGYPDLSFGGFCKPAEELDFLEFSAEEEAKIAEALEAIARAATAPDEEGGSPSSGSQAPSTGERKREKF